MSESFVEHRYYSFAPQVTAKCCQRVLETGVDLSRIPGRDGDVASPTPPTQILQPDHRTEPQTQHGRPLGAWPLPGLKFLASNKLFRVLEGVLHLPRKM